MLKIKTISDEIENKKKLIKEEKKINKEWEEKIEYEDD
jgi:hypothetical protein